jgi:cytochrome c2
MFNLRLHKRPFFVAIALLVGLFLSCSTLFAQDKPAGLALSTDEAVISSGKALFEGNCKQCHAVHKEVVGPQLSGVYDRQKLAWLINFIKYPQKTIESGDAHAKEMYAKYKQYMPNHDFLSDEQIISILSWVKKETDNPTVVAGAPTPGQPTDPKSGGVSSGLLTAVIVGLVVMLSLVLGALFLMAATLTKYLRQAKGLSAEDMEVLEPEWRLGDMLRSRAFIGIVAFLFLGLVSKAGLEGMLSIGVQQGYAPTQPIPFSHKLHAGQYEIACQYCHTGVEKGKSANIPSANICMNCHNAIKTTGPWMQKIYDHILKDEPIQWVRVHNLPDLAYFNHAQHVKVGGLACENCHGDIKEMEVVQQVSLLTMGWCIDCHRKTDVNNKGNAYYDNLTTLHASKSKKPMKVEDIGGLECGKCHY